MFWQRDPFRGLCITTGCPLPQPIQQLFVCTAVAAAVAANHNFAWPQIGASGSFFWFPFNRASFSIAPFPDKLYGHLVRLTSIVTVDVVAAYFPQLLVVQLSGNISLSSPAPRFIHVASVFIGETLVI